MVHALHVAILAASVRALASCGGPATGGPDARADSTEEAFDATADVPVLVLDGASVDPFDAGDASLGARVNALFASTTCAGGPESFCHSAGAAHLRLALLPHGGDVVGVRSLERPSLLRVRPGRPEASYLFLKVRGDGGIDGGRMPLGAHYDPRIVGLAGAWIEAGAPLP